MPTPHPSLAEAVRVWARVAALSFGGPAGQIAVMHRILVEERRWIGEDRFLHALNFCMVLPGPEAQQLATYIGWLTHGVRGALIAGGLFILPGAVAILALSLAYVTLGDLAVVEGLFFGLKCAVLAIVAQAVARVGRRALRGPAARVIAAAAFVAIFAAQVPFPAIVAGAALAGWWGARRGWRGFRAGGAGHGDPGPAGPSSPGARRGAFVAGLAALALWLAPIAALLVFAPGSVFADIAVFFSRLAVLTFGGAYAVLAWVAQEAVGTFGWLGPGEMLDGLGMAETTPGPLIMVLQFVGFMAAWRSEGDLMAATLGGLLATWVTFAPCFAWIFLGAPFMERLRGSRALAAALSAVTAAVVGVIANLALWFAIHVLWREVTRAFLGPLSVEVPVWSSLDPAAAGLTTLALIAVFRLRLPIGWVLALCAAGGAGLRLMG